MGADRSSLEVGFGFERDESILRFRQPFEPCDTFPQTKDVMGAIPKECFERSTFWSFVYLVISTVLTAAVGYGAWKFLPTPGTWTAPAIALWIAYAIVQGTVATGMWVVAHECGHGAFSENKVIENIVGFVIHSSMLVPYHSWQRSHAVHHSKTNHTTLGETHVPNPSDSTTGQVYLQVYNE